MLTFFIVIVLLYFLARILFPYKPPGLLSKRCSYTKGKVLEVYIHEGEYIHYGDVTFKVLNKYGLEEEATNSLNGIVDEINIKEGMLYDGGSYAQVRAMSEDDAVKYYKAKITNRQPNQTYIDNNNLAIMEELIRNKRKVYTSKSSLSCTVTEILVKRGDYLDIYDTMIKVIKDDGTPEAFSVIEHSFVVEILVNVGDHLEIGQPFMKLVRGIKL